MRAVELPPSTVRTAPVVTRGVGRTDAMLLRLMIALPLEWDQ